MAEPKNTGCVSALPGLRRELVAEPPVRDGRFVVDVRGEDRIVVVGEEIGQLGRKGGVVGAVRREVGDARAHARASIPSR